MTSEFGKEIWSIFALSLQVSGSAVLISSLVGIPLGVWIELSQFRGKRLLAVVGGPG